MPQAIMPANATTPAGTMDFKAKQMGKTKTQPNATAGITSAVATGSNSTSCSRTVPSPLA
jgi:hypothetical protein